MLTVTHTGYRNHGGSLSADTVSNEWWPDWTFFNSPHSCSFWILVCDCIPLSHILLILRLSAPPCPDCNHCKATSPASFLPSSSLPLLSFNSSWHYRPTAQHSWLPFLWSPSSPCLSFIHPSTQPCSILLLLTHYLSTAEIPYSLSLTLFFFSPQTMQCFLAATMVVVQAKSQTTCPVWIKSCWNRRKRRRDEKQQTEEGKGGLWIWVTVV